MESMLCHLSIQIDNESYIDGVNLEPEDFMGLMKNSQELPKSSQPAVGVFKELYDRLGEDGSEILSIHMTGGMSGTVRSAEAAAEMTEAKVTVHRFNVYFTCVIFSSFRSRENGCKRGRV